MLKRYVVKKLNAIADFNYLSVLKRLDSLISRQIFDIDFDENAWYYDKAKVQDYLGKNIP